MDKTESQKIRSQIKSLEDRLELLLGHKLLDVDYPLSENQSKEFAEISRYGYRGKKISNKKLSRIKELIKKYRKVLGGYERDIYINPIYKKALKSFKDNNQNALIPLIQEIYGPLEHLLENAFLFHGVTPRKS